MAKAAKGRRKLLGKFLDIHFDWFFWSKWPSEPVRDPSGTNAVFSRTFTLLWPMKQCQPCSAGQKIIIGDVKLRSAHQVGYYPSKIEPWIIAPRC